MRLVILATNIPARRGQLLAIQPSDVNFEEEYVKVIGSKNQPPRALPLNLTARTTLRAMIADGQLPFPLKDFRKRWYPMLERAGINSKDGSREENFHFHDLRKEMATEMIRNHVPAKHVQAAFGHSDMSVTDIYIHPDFAAMKQAVNALDATNLQRTQETDGPPN